MIKSILRYIRIFLFKVRGQVLRKIVYFFGLRPASYPYITGDGFRKMADHIYDELKKCSPTDINNGDIVFVNSSMLNEYFEEIHTHIKNKYILISHNSDQNIKEEQLEYIDSKIIKWYAQNVMVKHEKLIPIPFGLDNLLRFHTGMPTIFNKYSKKEKINRKNRIIFGFSINTNPKERQPFYDFLSNSKIADKLPWTQSPIEYFDIITNYKFIAAPDGNGHDDPRRWESMYIKIVPIVKNSVAMDYFLSLGLPLWVVDNWNEIEKYSENELSIKYDDIINNSSREALQMKFWLDMIIKEKEKVKDII